MTLPVVAVTGLLAEARIAAGPGVVTVAGGGDAARLALVLQAALSRGARAVISFGIAGGLRPDLRPGCTLIGMGIAGQDTWFESDRTWVARLAQLLPEAELADISGVDRAVCGVADKRALRSRTGAVAVDMESHVAARLAAQHGIPFAAVRVVADPAARAVPKAAAVGMRPDGTADVGAVLRALAANPRELPGLIRTAFDAQAAFAALRRCRRSLCDLLDVGDRHHEGLFGLPLHVDLDVLGGNPTPEPTPDWS